MEQGIFGQPLSFREASKPLAGATEKMGNGVRIARHSLGDKTNRQVVEYARLKCGFLLCRQAKKKRSHALPKFGDKNRSGGGLRFLAAKGLAGAALRNRLCSVRDAIRVNREAGAAGASDSFSLKGRAVIMGVIYGAPMHPGMKRRIRLIAQDFLKARRRTGKAGQKMRDKFQSAILAVL